MRFLSRRLARITAVLALAIASSAAAGNTLTFQNVTFSTTDQGGGKLELTISNALNANGDWAGINYLESFALDIGGTWTSASSAGWTFMDGGLSNGASLGCNGKGSGYACFYQPTTPFALSNDMVFDILFTGGTADFSLPHLKVDFWILSSQSKSTGSLLSQDIPLATTPLPAALPLFGTALGAMGLLGWYRRRKVGESRRYVFDQ
jgi:hypothetical protein